MIKTVQIHQYRENVLTQMEDAVCLEEDFEVHVNQAFYVALRCIPDKLEDWVTGFLFSEGMILRAAHIEAITIGTNKIDVKLNQPIPKNRNTRRTLSTGCGAGIINLASTTSGHCGILPMGWTCNAEILIPYMRELNQASALFRQTGGVHSCALADTTSIRYHADDIGRHHAADRVIGAALRNNQNLSEFMLLTTGRISSEIVAKAIRARIPLLVSLSAPTSYAIQMAQAVRLTVIGFCRGNRFNIYSAPERILVSQ